MSKPRDWWWPIARTMVKSYPTLRQNWEEIHAQKITPVITGVPMGGSGASRTTENAALRQMPPADQKAFDAVSEAIEITRMLPDGETRLKIVSLVLWDKRYTIEAAARKVGASPATAWRWHRDFLRLVGIRYGFKADI